MVVLEGYRIAGGVEMLMTSAVTRKSSVFYVYEIERLEI